MPTYGIVNGFTWLGQRVCRLAGRPKYEFGLFLLDEQRSRQVRAVKLAVLALFFVVKQIRYYG